MNKKTIIAAGAALTAIIAVAGLSIGTYASEGNFFRQKGFINNENREAVQTAMNSNDYETWKELAGDRINDKITADNFAKFVEAHNLMQSGDREGAEAIFAELGMEKPGRGPKGMMPDRGGNIIIREAINNNDYEAWKEAVGDRPMADEITADNWSQFVEAHNLMQSGDREGAEAIFDELGINMPGKGRGGMGGCMHKPINNTNGNGICDYQDSQDSN